MRVSGDSNAVLGYLRLFRLGNCVMAALGALLAAVACIGFEGLEDFVVEILLSMAIVICFTAAGNSYNDYFDREVDKVAHPDRPIPRGQVSPAGAMYVAYVLFLTAVLLSVIVSIVSVIIVITSIIVMVGYERFLKAEGLAGNLAISWLTGALFLFGGAAVESLELAWILAALAFLATLGREIVKDIQDIDGDRGTRVTLPMKVGPRKAGTVASIAFIIAVAMSPSPFLLGLMSVWYLPVVMVADGIFIYAASILFRSPEKGQKVSKLAMFVALLAFLIGGIL